MKFDFHMTIHVSLLNSLQKSQVKSLENSNVFVMVLYGVGNIHEQTIHEEEVEV